MGNNGSKVKGLFTEIKTHWNKPAKGKYVLHIKNIWIFCLA